MSFKGSDIEWVGQIPSHWCTLSVSKAYDVTLGKMLQPNSTNLNDLKVPYLKAMNVQDGYVNLEKIEEMYCSTNELNSFKLECGDLVVCEGGEVARSAVIKENLAGFIFQNSVHRVKGTARGDTRFLHYLLVVLRASGFINILVNKATIAHFTKDKFNSLKIALPQLNEQLKISDYLDYKIYKIETLIKAKQTLIDLLEQQRQSIITEAVTKGLNPNVKMKDSCVEWIGEIPEYWKVTKIKYNTYVKGRIGWQGLKSDEFIDEGPYLVTGTDFKNGCVTWDNCYHISEERYLEAPPIQLRENDLLITKDGTIGKLALVKNMPDKAILNSGVFVTRPIDNKYLSKYMYWLLSSSVFDKYISLMETGSTIKHLYQETFVNFAYPLPSLEEQENITNYLNGKIGDVDNIIYSVKEQISKLKEYRQSLIYEAVTGKIDGRDMELD